jgi:hypothetical protein
MELSAIGPLRTAHLPEILLPVNVIALLKIVIARAYLKNSQWLHHNSSTSNILRSLAYAPSMAITHDQAPESKLFLGYSAVSL